MEIDIKIIETDDDYQSCLFIRKQVFIIGQNIPVEIELDDDKINATYFLANLSGNPVGTARYRKTDFGIKLERFAVLENARNFGVGKALVLFILNHVKKEETIYLNAQESVIGFYEKLGFAPVGDQFYEASIPHKKLIYNK
jgi:predicted GNAT family N-acyltransferase